MDNVLLLNLEMRHMDFFFFFGHAVRRISVHWPRIELRPLKWKHGVLTIRELPTWTFVLLFFTVKFLKFKLQFLYSELTFLSVNQLFFSVSEQQVSEFPRTIANKPFQFILQRNFGTISFLLRGNKWNYPFLLINQINWMSKTLHST